MDRRAWWLQSSGVTKHPTWLSDWVWAHCYSVAKLCLTFCDPMDCTIPGSSILHSLSEFAQIHVIESVMPTNHLIFYFPLLLLPSIFPSIRFCYNNSAHCIMWPKYWSFQLQHQYFQWTFWVDFILSNTLPILFTTSKIMKESLRDCYRLKDIQNTWQWYALKPRMGG